MKLAIWTLNVILGAFLVLSIFGWFRTWKFYKDVGLIDSDESL